MKTKLSLIALSVCAVTFNSYATEAEPDLETITVTAARIAQGLDETLSSVKVISRNDIEAIKADSVIELLSQVSGLDISQQGGRGQSASVFMRGTNANHTLVLVDGVRISSATLGTSDLNSISPTQIDRIEVVKGPKAAIWGSDAIGGVIQIFTRKVDGLEADLAIGSEGYKHVSAAFGFEHGQGSSTITISKEKADGFDVLEAAEEDDDGFEHTSFTARGNQILTDRLSLNYLLQANKSDNEYDNAWAGNNQVETDNYAWYLSAKYAMTENNSVEVRFGQNQDSRENYGTAFKDLYETNRDQLSILSSNSINDDLTVVAGLDSSKESITTTSVYPTDERTVTGLFGVAQQSIGQFNVEFAIRQDDVEGIDKEITYNLGLGYEVSGDTNVGITHSTGFKAPTFNDLYSPFGGNDKLVSETSTTSEVLLKHNFGIAALGASVYKTNVDNLIAWEKQDDGSWTPQNIDEADIQGIEIDLNAQYAGLNHLVSFAYIDTEDGSTGKQLIRRAKKHFNYSVSAVMGELDIALNYSYKGKRTDTGDVELDAYSLVNFKVGYAINDDLSVNLKVNNLLDESYQNAAGYNTQGQAVYLGVSYR